MSVIGAKARSSELVTRAPAGRSAVVTRKCESVARIVPERVEKWDRSKVLDEAEAFRKRLKIKAGVDLCELIEERRR